MVERFYIDLDSGTILNGPIVALDYSNVDFDNMSDSDIVEYAISHGTAVS